MATCRDDCIHYEACKSIFEAQGYVVDGAGENADERCECFETVADRVVHARWKRRFIFNCCSACGFLFGVFDRWDYCPNCGAKMDQEADDNELC